MWYLELGYCHLPNAFRQKSIYSFSQNDFKVVTHCLEGITYISFCYFRSSQRFNLENVGQRYSETMLFRVVFFPSMACRWMQGQYQLNFIRGGLASGTKQKPY
jgi:hypothetical protein